MSRTRDVCLPRGGCVKVDSGIARFVARLNAAGLPTVSCCSGLRRDHPGEDMDASQGYLLFGHLGSARARVENAARGCGMGIEGFRRGQQLRVDVSVLRDGTRWSPMLDMRVREALAHARTGPEAEEASRDFICSKGGFVTDAVALSMWRCLEEALFPRRR